MSKKSATGSMKAADYAARQSWMARWSSPGVLIPTVLTLLAGCAIAYMDSRPSWDDTGVTAGALFLVSGGSAIAGVPVWLALVLVAGPMVALEVSGGMGVLMGVPITLVGALVGALVHRIVQKI